MQIKICEATLFSFVVTLLLHFCDYLPSSPVVCGHIDDIFP